MKAYEFTSISGCSRPFRHLFLMPLEPYVQPRQIRQLVLSRELGQQECERKLEPFANIRDTRKRFATSRSLAPTSISSAAANRTRSQRARSAAVSPLPSGYLMVPP
jgi:hypothetical protein